MNAPDIYEFTDEELDQLCWSYWLPLIEDWISTRSVRIETGEINVPETVP